MYGTIQSICLRVVLVLLGGMLFGSPMLAPAVTQAQSIADQCAGITPPLADIPLLSPTEEECGSIQGSSPNAEIRPSSCVRKGQQIEFVVSDTPPGLYTVTFTTPNQSREGPFSLESGDDGGLQFSYKTATLVPGMWRGDVRQLSNEELIAQIYFKIVGEPDPEARPLPSIDPNVLMPRLVPTIPQEEWGRDMRPEQYCTVDEAIEALNGLGYSPLQIVIKETRDGRYPRNMVWTTNPTAYQSIPAGQSIELFVIRHGEDKGPGGGDLENP